MVENMNQENSRFWADREAEEVKRYEREKGRNKAGPDPGTQVQRPELILRTKF